MEIRRRPPNPKVRVAHLEYAVPHDESEPRNILEKIVWAKDREVEAARQKVPLDTLKQQISTLPPTRNFFQALRGAAVKPAVIAEVKKAKKFKGRLDIPVGTMIEIPRAALTADKVAEVADFFSFGTNDLTQMAFGYSRDDAGVFLPDYVSREILAKDPFNSLDVDGVGQLVEMACTRGRKTKRGLKLGICGEHGGDPASIAFCEKMGLDYVSCSPFRVPVARLAAAQAAL